MDNVFFRAIRITVVFITALSLITSQAYAGADPATAVRDWYAVVRNASWVEAGYGGTLGGPEGYQRAYKMLARGFRATVSERSFLDRFKDTVYIRLDQADLISIQGSSATVFVEDSRDMVLHDLPATVHFYGSVSLVREHGSWAIDGFYIAPEASTIYLRDFGHSSGGYIIDTSWVPIARYLGVPSIDFKRIGVPRNIAQGPITVTYSDGVNKIALDLARLYSGVYIPLIVRDLSAQARQPRVLFSAPLEGPRSCPSPWCMKLRS